MPDYNGLTRNQWPGTWSPSSSHPIVLDTEMRGGLRYVSGSVGDRLSNITGQRLQDGMIVYVENGYTENLTTYEGGKYYKYTVLPSESRNASTGELPNDSANWGLFSTSDISEGTNQYYTTAKADSDARSALVGHDAGGDGSFSYDSATGIFTYTGPNENEVRAHFTANKGLSVTSGEFNIDSSNVRGMFSGGTGITYNSGTGEFTTTDADIVHDNLSGFVANEHIDHTSVLITGGKGLSGGGTIASSRVIDIDSANVRGMFSGGTGITYNSGTGEFTTTDGDIVHDDLSGFVANEHIDHTSVSVVAGKGLSGGGTIASTRTIDIDSSNVRGMLSGGTGITYNSSTGEITSTDGDIVHDDLSGFVANEHINHTSVSVIAGKGLTGGGTIAADRTIDIDSANVRGMFSGSNGISYSTGTGDIRAAQPLDSSANPTFNQLRGPATFVIDPATIGDATGTVQILGNLQVDGTTTTINSTDVTIDDKTFTLADNAADSSALNGGGIIWGGSSIVDKPSFTYNHASARFDVNRSIAIDSANAFLFDISGKELKFADNHKAVFGNSGDLSIAHDGNNSLIRDEGSGSLYFTVNGSSIFLRNASAGEDLAKFISNGAVELYYDDSKKFETTDSGVSVTGQLVADSSTFTNVTGTIQTAAQPNIDHDQLTNFVSNEHINHTSVSVIAGKGLSGGGTIASSRTIDIDSANVRGMFSGGTGITYNSGTGEFTTTDGDIVHDNLSGFVANEHINHTSVSIATGTGLSGGGDISSTRTLKIDSSELASLYSKVIAHDNTSGFVANEHIDHSGVSIIAGKGLSGGGTIASSRTIDIDSANVRGMFSGGTGITYNSGTGAISTTDGDIVHDDLSGFVANEHIDHSGVSIVAGKGLSGGGTIASSRTIDIDSANIRGFTVADAINNGTTNIAPSQNAVFDALALKLDASAVPTLGNDFVDSAQVNILIDARDTHDSAAVQGQIDSSFDNLASLTVTGEIDARGGITDNGGNLELQASDGNHITLSNHAGNILIRAKHGGSADLRHQGNIKLETTDSGVTVTGSILADSATISRIVLQESADGDFALANLGDGRVDFGYPTTFGPAVEMYNKNSGVASGTRKGRIGLTYGGIDGTGDIVLTHRTSSTWIQRGVFDAFGNFQMDGQLDADSAKIAGPALIGGNGSTGGVTVSDGLIDMRTGTGNVSKIKFYCEANNAHFQTLQAAPHSAGSSAVIVLPTASGTLLNEDGSGASLTNLNASNLGSGTVPSARLSLSASDIPNLATSKITSGVFDSARIPSLSTSDIVTGTFDSARLPVIDATRLGGVQSSSFLRSDSADAFSGVLTATAPIEFNGGVTYDPSSTGAGSDTATDVGVSLGSGTRIVGHTDGYIRTLLEWNASGNLQIGQNNTSFISTTQIYGGANGGVELYEGTSKKLETTLYGASVTGSFDADSATIMGGSIFFDSAGNSERLQLTTQNNQSTDILKIQTNDGSISIGAANTTYAHILSDRDLIYIEKTVEFGSNEIRSYNNDFQIKRDNSDTHKIVISDSDVQIHNGVLHIHRDTAPSDTVDKLYNVGGSLFWNGTDVTGGGSGGAVDSSTTISIIGDTVNNAYVDALNVNAATVTATANNSTDESVFIAFVDGATGEQGIETDTSFTYNPSTNTLSIGTGSNPITIDDGGTITATGNALTLNGATSTTLQHNGATKLQTTSSGVTVTGLLSATTKSFDIKHPTEEGKRLRYASLEGPENGVYVRGRLKDNNTIELPDYWTGLVDEDTITVNLTAIGKHQEVYVEDIADNKVIIGGENINCFYTVYGERKDVDQLVVEYDA